MTKIICNDCGYHREVALFLDYADNRCLNCGSEDLEIVKIQEMKQAPTGDNYPNLNMLNDSELHEIQRCKLPKITLEDVEDFIIDLETKTIEQLLKKESVK